MRRIARLVVVGATMLGAASCGGNATSEPTRAYTLGLEVDDSGERYRYVATGDVDIRVGDEVTFELHNTGSLPHDLQIVDPDGDEIALAPPIVSGDRLSVTARFDEAGFFRLNCLVDDHLTVHDMQTFIEVTESTG